MMPNESQVRFYREFLMARGKFNPLDFGVNLERDAFMDVMVEDFNEAFKGGMSIDELCLRPRAALAFCDDVRRKHGKTFVLIEHQHERVAPVCDETWYLAEGVLRGGNNP